MWENLDFMIFVITDTFLLFDENVFWFCLDKAQLCLFGSSKNGFGFRDSDLDICMTLEGHDTAEV